MSNVGPFQLAKLIVTHPLNKNSKSTALWRFARWQIASRLIRMPIALPFVDGASLLVETGMTGATGNWYYGLQEAAEMAFVLHALCEDDLFLDVGANIGGFSIMAAAACNANVISVEPLPLTFERLRKNIRLNALDIEAHCCGLSSEVGELTFLSSHDTMNRVALESDVGPKTVVPVQTLDALCQGRPPKLVKIDVEGHELNVLDGARDTLSSPDVKAVLMETNGSGKKFGVTDAALVGRMSDHNFTSHTYDPYSRTFSSGIGKNNTIFLRDVNEMQKVVRNAPRHRLVNGEI